MYNMKTASIREARHDLPATRRETVRAKMPDVSARLQKVFGRKVISDKAMKEILDESRGTIEGLR